MKKTKKEEIVPVPFTLFLRLLNSIKHDESKSEEECKGCLLDHEAMALLKPKKVAKQRKA